MNTDEIFANRRAIATDICRSIRENGSKLLNAKHFLERPYSDGEHSYKFSSANILRLLAADNDALRRYNPRWVSVDEIKNNGWSLREHSEPVLLEVWSKSSDGEQSCSLIEFYNAWSILDNNSFTPDNQELETIIENLQARGLFEQCADIISFQDCIDAVKKYAEDNGADELTSILTVQSWITESKLKTKMSLFLPTYSDSVLATIEQNPDKLFESMNKARSILKNLRREKEIPIEENTNDHSAFRDLKIIYHGSEVDLQDKNRNTYSSESILTGEAAYEFLCALKSNTSEETFKTWLEFSYKGYSHGKFLLADKIPKNEPISNFLRSRLDKNRQHLLQNPQDLKPYIPSGKTIRADDLLQQIKTESTFFQTVMDDFELEEKIYLQNHPELF